VHALLNEPHPTDNLFPIQTPHFQDDIENTKRAKTAKRKELSKSEKYNLGD